MSHRHAARASLLAFPLTLVALMGVADVAAAQAGTSCRGSAARGGDAAAAITEPVVANASSDPCVTDVAKSVEVAPQSGLTVLNPRARTVRSAGLIGASSGIEKVTGTASGTVSVEVGAIEAQQTVVCRDGAPVSAGSSTVERLVIDGTPVAGVVGSNRVDTMVPTPAGVFRVRANQIVDSTRTALIIDFPGGAQQVFGEATAGGDACLPLSGEGNGGGNGNGGGAGGHNGGGNASPEACPKGSEYVVADNRCVIREQGADGSAQTIVVGRPFEGPSGGTVISVLGARKRFGSKACLKGKGPRFAIIGTNRNDRITGTNGRDRILTLAGNDRADGGRGDDCIDGGSGRDILSGALGRDSVFGRSGNDSLNGGGNSDLLSGGSGNDTINAAFGADTVTGGSGRDAINVATAGPLARVNCGTGRDKVRLNNREKRNMRGCETRYVLKDR